MKYIQLSVTEFALIVEASTFLRKLVQRALELSLHDSPPSRLILL